MWPAQETIVERLGRAFRERSSHILEQPLPGQWIELMQRLDEVERRRSPQQYQVTRETARRDGGKRYREQS